VPSKTVITEQARGHRQASLKIVDDGGGNPKLFLSQEWGF
jgi:hypothetical protein